VGRQKIGIALKAMVLRRCGGWGSRKLRETIFGKRPTKLPPPIQAFVDFVSLIHEHFRPRMTRLPVFGDDTLKKLTMPVLAIVGGKDVMLDSAETRRRLERNLAQVEVRYLAEAGHVIVGQTGAIAEFLLVNKTGDKKRSPVPLTLAD
jgi:pimeloyl-ACP methyl ester carboxylesterase